MWLAYTLIIWASCSVILLSCMEEPTTSLLGLEQNITVDDYNESDNISMIELGDAFRRQISRVIIPVDSQNRTEEIEALLSLSNISLADYQRDNSSKFFKLRKKNKEDRLQAIKDTILLVTGRNRTLNVSATENEGNLKLSNATFQSSSISDNGTIHGSRSRDERKINPRSLDDYDFAKRQIAFNLFAGEWLNSYYHNSSKPEPLRERLWVGFDDIGFGDIIVIPKGFNWIICSKHSNVNFEIFTKLNTASYPLPIRRHASTVVQLLAESRYTSDLQCVASGWEEMSVIYFDDENEPQRTELKDFLPTNCICKNS